MRLLRQNHRLDLMLAAERKDDVGQKRLRERERVDSVRLCH